MTEVGIDVGTTFTSAAVSRRGRVEVVGLGTRAAVIPTVVHLGVHGDVLIGDAAERRALTEPSRLAREFKRRLGDPTPLILGGVPVGAEVLMGHILAHVVERVTEREGARPTAIAVSHPASWGEFKLDLLRDAVRRADITDAVLVPEPVAAARYYSSLERIAPSDVVAVYDLGGGTFDASVVRADGAQLVVLGQPEGLERLGGIDFDAAVVAHVDEVLGGALQELDPSDPTTAQVMGRLRDECRAAKEALSEDTDILIHVALPSMTTEVRLTRHEFEAMIRPRIDDTIDALERAIRSAGLTTDQISRVLLVGGSSAVPLVRQLLRERLGRPVSADADPNTAIAQGAAAVASESTQVTAAAPSPATPTPKRPAITIVPPDPGPPAPGSTKALGDRPAPRSVVAVGPDDADPVPWWRRPATMIAAAMVAAIAIAIATLGGGDDGVATGGSGEPSDISEPIDSGAPTPTRPTESTTTRSTSTTSTTTTTTTIDPAAGFAPTEYTTANDRTTIFGGATWNVDAITLTNAYPVFDDDTDADITIGHGGALIELLVSNDTRDTIVFDNPRGTLVLADDTRIVGGWTPGDGGAISAGTADTYLYTFDMEEIDDPTAADLAGAVLLLDNPGLLAAGIPLDGPADTPPVIDAIPLGATHALEGSGGSVTIHDVRAGLDTRTSSGGAQHDELRAPIGSAWITITFRFDCQDGGPGGCLTGGNNGWWRVDVDGHAQTSFDFNLFDDGVDAARTSGTSSEHTLDFVVPVGEVYTLLVGNPQIPESVLALPVPVNDQVDALYASVERYQLD